MPTTETPEEKLAKARALIKELTSTATDEQKLAKLKRLNLETLTL